MFQLSKVNWRIALPLLAVLLIVGIAVFGFRSWKNHKAKDPLSDLGPGIYQPASKANSDTLPVPAPRR